MSTITESLLVGLIGDGITASLTPPMHEREAAACGLHYLYRPVDLAVNGRSAADVGDLLRYGRDLGFNAFNITHPCKQLVLEHLDEVSEDAARLGAVNTVLIQDGRFIGHNTDYSGFATALAQGLPDAALDAVVQLGAGGAGAAVAYALLKAGTRELTLIDLDPERTRERAAALAALFPDAVVRPGSREDLGPALSSADGFVQATPVGMHSHPGLPLDPELLRPESWVADVIYRPVRTQLVDAAEARGCRVLDGGHMAVGQAVDAFRLISGVEPDAARMRAHFLELVNSGR
ncbi:shikimate dehydrogenase [Arthrobacter sp. zg-Y916]|uniref:shikimate dehydrogenase n=1 Tax=Arthrobacter sp. zg-Y916 TaxID=2894190 RepID=UPI001E60B2EA|nr:shikimate dehydrogenase [Arthrobacter sp. zg-Y916]MCC9193400.1 shikimate dehydrogenase [Arthrobacter sp. zg-Y916]